MGQKYNLQTSGALFRATEEVDPRTGNLREAIGDDRGWEPLKLGKKAQTTESSNRKKGDIISECRHVPGYGRNLAAADGCGIGSRKSTWGCGCQGLPGNSQFMPEVWVDTSQAHKEAWG